MRNLGGGKRGQPTKESLFHSLHTQTFTYSFRQEKKFTALVSLTYENIQKFNPYAIATPLRHFWWWEAWSTTLPTKKNLFFAPHTLKLLLTASVRKNSLPHRSV